MAHQINKVIYHQLFVKHFRQRIGKYPKLVNQYAKRYGFFVADRQNLLLKDHQLTGDLAGKRAFSIGGDLRVVYREKEKGVVEFMDIGSHNQVYR
jgi:addiction module RelE/StbE family toxin